MDVDFSQGSVVVKYLLEMKKAAAASTVSTVRNAIVENSGKFAGYSVDVNSIQASFIRKGSVIVDFFLGIDDVMSSEKLAKIFSGNPFMIRSKNIDPDSFVFSGPELWERDPGPPTVDPGIALKYEQQRMDVLNRAIQGMEDIHWSLARKFKDRNLPRAADDINDNRPRLPPRSAALNK
ncbi:hypothetical protein NP493_816g02002 [Ridgeia piscesae]|uniref:Uncharacterized protein n=1 Tax=Ridgeia piscesae TaxID=27915 RepID=A0AAD9NMU4_RIDPI|nr:hypothetical protein NP493_816g02002 [Ridgeia piscesae]